MVPRLYSYKDCAPAAIQALTFVVNGGFSSHRQLSRGLRRQLRTTTGFTKEMTVVPTASLNKVGLTARERQVLERLQLGASNKLIARQFNLRESTVKAHIRQIMRKLGAVNRAQAALYGVRLGIPATDAKKPTEAA